ncbi:NADH-quinone oxidoreductase subunit NuoN [Nakamurella endophytica]|uniref:NADH-quinone oxidoreductase subunit N n=1 Tax=Nakamurella endophytica TaxID=1748367 RepID=A0A917SZI3_9ACTN|nr:NADH-quinone oxidoreductase subunit NuoN [Nakamurella endophytica]GGM03697.1 NADH-quinone oxidoreductase subunit N [Nakamurella endophytica]
MTAASVAAVLQAAPPDAITAPSVDLTAVMPVLIVLGAACVAVVLEALLPRERRYAAQVTLTVAAIVVAGFWTLLEGSRHRYAVTFAGSVAVDGGTYVMWGVLLVLALPSVLLMADRVAEPGGAFVAQAAARVGSARDRVATQVATPMQTEVFPLTLFAVGGMLVFPAASDLLTLFVALEVLSLPLYLLCGLARRRRLISQESAVKYFLLGAFTSALLLYGIALIYGYAGSIRFTDIAARASAGSGSDTLLLAGIALLTVGLLFKASVGPFHLWTPDVYQGAPTPVTAFMAACTKVAAFAAMLRVFSVALQPMYWTWRPVLWVVAIASMLIGAVLGITQTDMKRVLAYSSVAHAGFIILGVMALSQQGASGTMFYLLTYGFATIGAFAIFTVVRRGSGEASRLSDWAGLARRSPVLAASMSLFLLSFAGIPLTSGFIGKLSVFTAAVGAGMAPLVVVAMVATAITAFFYLKVVVLMYFSPPAGAAEDGAGEPYVVVPGPLTAIVIGLSVVVTLVLGIAPSWFLHLLSVPFPFTG